MPGFGLIQPVHLLLILAIVLIVFGADKLSQVGGALGKSVREFKESVAEEADEGEPPAAEPPALPTRPEARTPEHMAAPPPLRREEV
jgi:sec-independent protein translocase protein TatA